MNQIIQATDVATKIQVFDVIKTFPKLHLIAAAGISLVVGATLVFSPSADVEAKRMTVNLTWKSLTARIGTATDSTVRTGQLTKPGKIRTLPAG